jgi:tubulin monoglycylase TTLL3/8
MDRKWTGVVVPRMQQAIVGTMLASQEIIVSRVNSFTLYGADFMISDDYLPWLIEINSQPCMAPTTTVTARMCPEVIEDLCKGKVLWEGGGVC